MAVQDLRKKRSFKGVSQLALAHLTSRTSKRHVAGQQAEVPADVNRNWSDLPEHLIEEIFLAIKDNAGGKAFDKSYFSTCGVCTAWRAIGHRLLFTDPDSTPFCKPSQLFQLIPKHANSNLVQCFVERTTAHTGIHGKLHKFTLCLGADHLARDGRRLLSAIQETKQRYSLYLDSGCASSRVATLAGNVLRTNYTLRAESCSWLGSLLRQENTPHGDSEVLARINFKLRMRGMVLPRRMAVALPHCPSRCDSRGSAATLDARVGSGCVPDHDVPELTSAWSAGSLDEVHPLPAAAAAAAAIGLPAEAARVDVGAPEISDAGAGQRDQDVDGDVHAGGKPAVPATVSSSEQELELCNKSPHWNEVLHCWCLNFRGRVKLPSVKNFQLIRAGDARASVLMQFGKVDANTFILDFDPTLVTPAQAFAVALTTFETKLLI